MAELSPEEKDAAAAMYNHLVTPSGTKIAHRAGDLAGYASIDEAETQHVLQRLVEERIVRAAEDGAEGPRYEIFHDVLADAVLAWRTEHEAERKLEAERATAARRHRRLLEFAIGALVLIAILGAIAVYALVQRGDARSQAHRARGRELAAKALTSAPVDPEQAVRDAVQATRFERSPAVADVLRTTLLGMRVKAVLPAGGKPVADVDFSPDGKRLVVAGGDGVARIYRASDGKHLRDLRDGSALSAAVFSPDGTKIATAGDDSTARLWDARSGALLHVLRHARSGHERNVLARRAPARDHERRQDGSHLGRLDRPRVAATRTPGRRPVGFVQRRRQAARDAPRSRGLRPDRPGLGRRERNAARPLQSTGLHDGGAL